MESKGVFLIKAAGAPTPQASGGGADQTQKVLSVREKAKLIENRLQSDLPTLKPAVQPLTRKVLSQWPPEKPSADESKERENVDLEFDLSVKEVQSHFEGQEGTPHVNSEQTNTSGRAVHQWPPPVAPSAVQVAYLVQKSSAFEIMTSADVNKPGHDATKTGNDTTKAGIGNKTSYVTHDNTKAGNDFSKEAIKDKSEEKPSAISVKDIIKRLQYERDANAEAISPNENRIRNVGGKTETNSQNEKECVIIHSDVKVEDLEQSPNETRGGKEPTQDAHTKGSGCSSSSEGSSGDLDPTAEGMTGDLELTWRNETVLENSLRQAVTQMLHPPPVHCLYPEEGGDDIGDVLLGEDTSRSPSLHSSLNSAAPGGLLDVRNRAWQEDPSISPQIQTAEHLEADGNTQEQIFIPIEADTAPTSGLNPIVMSPRRVTSSYDVTSSMEEMALTSDFLLSNDTVSEVVKVKDVQSHPDACLADDDVETLNKKNQDGLPVQEPLIDPSYNKEVLELNRKMADSLISPLRTVNEDEIKAIVANHQHQQRQIFSKFFSPVSNEEETSMHSQRAPQDTAVRGQSGDENRQPAFSGGKPEVHLTTGTSKQEVGPISGFRAAKPELEPVVRVDVLSQLADDDASETPPGGNMDAEARGIWIPKNAESLSSDYPTTATTTSTTTFRIGQADNSKTDQNSSDDEENSPEDVPGISLSELSFSLAMGSGTTVEQAAEEHVTISLPGSERVLANSHIDNNNKQLCDNEKLGANNAPQDKIIITHDTEGKPQTMDATFVSIPGTFKTQTFSRVKADLGPGEQQEEDDTSMCGTFVMKSAVVDTHTFSRVKVDDDEDVSGSESDAMSCSGDESSAILTDGDEDDDMRRLQQRYGEILQWSDTEKLSGASDDDESVDDSEEQTEDSQQQNLEQSLKLSLTMDIKEKLPTLTEKDFSSMMSDYRDVLKQADRNNCSMKGQVQTVHDRFETARSRFAAGGADASDGDDDGDQPEYLQTVMFQPKLEGAPCDTQTVDSGLGDDTLRDNSNPSSASCDMATGMGGTLLHTQHTLNTIKLMCDASTSMGVGTLRACLGMEDAGKVVTSESGVMTSESGMMTSETAVVTSETLTTSQNTSETQTEPGAVTKDAIVGGEDAGYSVQDKEMAAGFRAISQDLEAADREMVDTLTRSTHAGEQLGRQWTELLSEYIEQSESLRMSRQLEVQRHNQKLRTKLLHASTTHTETLTETQQVQIQEKTTSSTTTSSTECQTAGVQVAAVGIQVEEDMLRLKEDLLARLRCKDDQVLDQEEMVKIFTEYREGQRVLVDRRLSDKARANQKLQERLQAKRELRKAREIKKAEEPSIKDRVRELDDAFYSDLCQRQRTLTVTNEELQDLVSGHVDKTEKFRRKLETEVAKTRQEAIQKRLAQTEENIENKERDASLANELVQKEKENADIVKTVRERERARFDEKLKVKLAERKKRKDQKDVEGIDVN